MGGEGCDPGDRCVGHGQGCPAVAGNTGAGGQGKQMVVALGDTSGREGDGAQRAGPNRVGGVAVFKKLDVGGYSPSGARR